MGFMPNGRVSRPLLAGQNRTVGHFFRTTVEICMAAVRVTRCFRRSQAQIAPAAAVPVGTRLARLVVVEVD